MWRAGYFYSAVIVTVALVIVLSILNRVENKLFHPKVIMPINMWIRGAYSVYYRDSRVFQLEICKNIDDQHRKNYDDQDTKISLEFSSKRASLVDKIQEKVSQTPGLRKVFFGKSIQI